MSLDFSTMFRKGPKAGKCLGRGTRDSRSEKLTRRNEQAVPHVRIGTLNARISNRTGVSHMPAVTKQQQKFRADTLLP
jgi:hypothetical protein